MKAPSGASTPLALRLTQRTTAVNAALLSGPHEQGVRGALMARLGRRSESWRLGKKSPGWTAQALPPYAGQGARILRNEAYIEVRRSDER
jgi:hypothetical protein